MKEQILAEANLVQIMLDKSIKGLIEKDIESLNEVFELEDRVNSLELEIDEVCTSLIALYQPEAKDLRTVLMIYKMNTDLERMADHAVNIAESAHFLIERPPLKIMNDIPAMYRVVLSMYLDSILSFNQEDILLAKDICSRDIQVNQLNKEIISHLIEDIKSDTHVVERAFHVLRISKNLERVADLTTNISEEIIFMVEGRVIKHNL